MRFGVSHVCLAGRHLSALPAIRSRFRQQFGDAFEFHPPLILRTLEFGLDHAVEIAHIVVVDLTVLHSDEGAVMFALFALLDKIIEAHAGKPRRLDAVERGGVAALLQVPKDGGTHVEHIPALLLEE